MKEGYVLDMEYINDGNNAWVSSDDVQKESTDERMSVLVKISETLKRDLDIMLRTIN